MDPENQKAALNSLWSGVAFMNLGPQCYNCKEQKSANMNELESNQVPDETAAWPTP